MPWVLRKLLPRGKKKFKIIIPRKTPNLLVRQNERRKRKILQSHLNMPKSLKMTGYKLYWRRRRRRKNIAEIIRKIAKAINPEDKQL